MDLTICTLSRGGEINNPWFEWNITQFVKLQGLECNITYEVYTDKISDFSRARSMMDSLCDTDWVLHLDSDEYILTKDLLRILESKLDPRKCYGFQRYNYFGDYEHIRVDSGCFPDTQRRLYNKKYYSWHGKVHETVLARKGNGVGGSDFLINPVIIHHFSWLKSPQFQVEKHKRFHELRGVNPDWKYPEYNEVTVRKVPNIKEIIEKELKE